MEGLQIAQIIADLQTLQNADPSASKALLQANKALLASPNAIRRKSRAAILPDPPKFDKLGRRILTITAPATPSSGSGTSTPALGASQEIDDDMKRAKTLLELVEMRGKFKQMGDTGLTRAKQRVDAVVTKYAQMDLEEREKAARSRHEDF